MRRALKVRSLATGIPLRKAAMSATAAARRTYPVWIDANERGVAFPATIVTSRVRDALVLRTVTKPKAGGKKGLNDARNAR